MIIGHVPAVHVPPDHAASCVVAARPVFGTHEASQGATADLAVSQPYTMAVAGRGQLVVPGFPASLAAPFL